MMDKQSQVGGDQSINIQSEKAYISTGLNYNDVKEIFMDLYRDNIIRLKSEAKEIAEERANEIIDQFITERLKAGDTSFSFAKEPRFQESFFNGQKAYALSGDNNNKDIIVEMLSKMCSSDDSSELVIAEAINVIGKLNYSQISTLTIIYYLRCLQTPFFTDERFELLLKTHLDPFIKDAKVDTLVGNYLNYTGCINIYTTAENLLNQFIKTYPGFTKKSVSHDDIFKLNIHEHVLRELFNFDNSVNAYSFKTSNANILNAVLNICISSGILNHESSEELKKLFNKTPQGDSKTITDRLSKAFPKVYSLMTHGLIKYAYLTPVGKVIAYYNLNRHCKFNNSIESQLEVL